MAPSNVYYVDGHFLKDALPEPKLVSFLKKIAGLRLYCQNEEASYYEHLRFPCISNDDPKKSNGEGNHTRMLAREFVESAAPGDVIVTNSADIIGIAAHFIRTHNVSRVTLQADEVFLVKLRQSDQRLAASFTLKNLDGAVPRIAVTDALVIWDIENIQVQWIQEHDDESKRARWALDKSTLESMDAWFKEYVSRFIHTKFSAVKRVVGFSLAGEYGKCCRPSESQKSQLRKLGWKLKEVQSYDKEAADLVLLTQMAKVTDPTSCPIFVISNDKDFYFSLVSMMNWAVKQAGRTPENFFHHVLIQQPRGGNANDNKKIKDMGRKHGWLKVEEIPPKFSKGQMLKDKPPLKWVPRSPPTGQRNASPPTLVPRSPPTGQRNASQPGAGRTGLLYLASRLERLLSPLSMESSDSFPVLENDFLSLLAASFEKAFLADVQQDVAALPDAGLVQCPASHCLSSFARMLHSYAVDRPEFSSVIAHLCGCTFLFLERGAPDLPDPQACFAQCLQTMMRTKEHKTCVSGFYRRLSEIVLCRIEDLPVRNFFRDYCELRRDGWDATVADMMLETHVIILAQMNVPKVVWPDVRGEAIGRLDAPECNFTDFNPCCGAFTGIFYPRFLSLHCIGLQVYARKCGLGRDYGKQLAALAAVDAVSSKVAEVTTWGNCLLGADALVSRLLAAETAAAAQNTTESVKKAQVLYSLGTALRASLKVPYATSSACGRCPKPYAAESCLFGDVSLRDLQDLDDASMHLALASSFLSLHELKNLGVTACQLMGTGCSASDLKGAGYSASDLKGAGYSASDLKGAGYHAWDLKGAGYSASDLKGAGYSLSDLSLFAASQNGHLAVVDLLLGKGADVNEAANDGRTSLYAASQNGHLEVVDLLLGKGADVNEAANDGRTSLYAASQNGHLEVVDLLLGKGADVNKATNDGWTSLYAASQNGHLAVVDLLLGKGADVNEAMNDGRKSLYIASHDGWTSLHIASQEGHLAVVDLLLGKGADVNKAANDGCTSLYAASQNGHLAVVDLLLGKGADVNKAENDCWTSLHIASQYGHLAVVDLLLGKGADVNKAANDGCTSLHIASLNGHLAVVDLLLGKGADVNEATNDGWTSLYAASQYGHLAVVDLLLGKGAFS